MASTKQANGCLSFILSYLTKVNKNDEKKTITVLTPTYNRASLLKACYRSLLAQTCKDFNWLIVDDGSNDDTKEVVESFCKEEVTDIKYLYKPNGGKHTALNLGISKCSDELILILDSDDILTEDAIETVLKCHDKYKNKKELLCGYSFLKVTMDGKVVGNKHAYSEEIDDFINMRINKKIDGDKCEVFYTDILKEYPFPVFDNEKFLGESVVWISMALKYKMVFINEAIYQCEYLEGGLTQSGRKLRINCPQGGMCYAKLNMMKEFKLLHRIKYGILYNTYSLFARENLLDIFREKENTIILLFTRPLGHIVYLLWKKYK